MIFGIDPGPVESAFAVVHKFPRPYEILVAGKLPNEDLIKELKNPAFEKGWFDFNVVVESIQSYGFVVGKSVFETCYTIGRIIQVCKDRSLQCTLYPRPEYARALVGGQKVTDSLLRLALMNRFGGDKKGEPLHQLRGNPDKRSAFALCVHHLDRLRWERQKKEGELLEPAPPFSPATVDPFPVSC